MYKSTENNSVENSCFTISDAEAMKIHGLYVSDGYSSDTDSGKSSFDEEYFRYKPQPLKIHRSEISIVSAEVIENGLENVDDTCDLDIENESNRINSLKRVSTLPSITIYSQTRKQNSRKKLKTETKDSQYKSTVAKPNSTIKSNGNRNSLHNSINGVQTLKRRKNKHSNFHKAQNNHFKDINKENPVPVNLHNKIAANRLGPSYVNSLNTEIEEPFNNLKNKTIISKRRTGKSKRKRKTFKKPQNGSKYLQNETTVNQVCVPYVDKTNKNTNSNAELRILSKKQSVLTSDIGNQFEKSQTINQDNHLSIPEIACEPHRRNISNGSMFKSIQSVDSPNSSSSLIVDFGTSALEKHITVNEKRGSHVVETNNSHLRKQLTSNVRPLIPIGTDLPYHSSSNNVGSVPPISGFINSNITQLSLSNDIKARDELKNIQGMLNKSSPTYLKGPNSLSSYQRSYGNIISIKERSNCNLPLTLDATVLPYQSSDVRSGPSTSHFKDILNSNSIQSSITDSTTLALGKTNVSNEGINSNITGEIHTDISILKFGKTKENEGRTYNISEMINSQVTQLHSNCSGLYISNFKDLLNPTSFQSSITTPVKLSEYFSVIEEIDTDISNVKTVTCKERDMVVIHSMMELLNLCCAENVVCNCIWKAIKRRLIDLIILYLQNYNRAVLF